MKYLEEPQLSWLNSVLGSYEIGDRVLNGKIETYSCKKAGSDKRLAKSLELYYQQEIEAAADLLGSSPLGPIAAPATRKLLINLISTMNASFPDYDFSAVKPEQFRKEPDFRIALQRINHDLAELLEAEGNGFVEKMWEAIAEAIKLDECDVYSYIPDMDSDPFSDGNLWSFNYFFYNKVQKKVLYFTCLCKGLTYDSDMDDETMEDSVVMDDDGEDAMEDYFGMSPDWYEQSLSD
ncbi:hypothetical protein, variant 2 [Phytophthora nicotianae INRA-310]|uniref:Repressor of RNA polymerase III transcription n=1 Tax=Phytophthora nicotianae (strain INRA-310) TaxID=761204 RepID=W2RHD5_PHYN3|nr:hypothetical protein, variant 2 [Phytophthora nicotianae INRA-310]ETN24084.1 hypothetical protein, variant 2 [Phytophthora nicotianae INRA-310]